ncbi:MULTISPECIES: GNAT family N-acetyltransferase [Kordiimonas]|jgi:RimJ/RimL family protein N-acetyltransferase|uniref:GNAT family N-acetyltransferase n=1 Tax=Kordiimonas TaxID=288021 RepID=UPI00257DEEF5|nr:GNAT family N-acetyltransferase [Kordiimonas sp. UBA4487]
MADSGIPITRHSVPDERQQAIRQAVRTASRLPTPDGNARLATPEDAAAFHAFLSDPKVHAPIYTLPRPLTTDSVLAFIKQHEQEQADGVGLLFLNLDAAGHVVGYSDFCVWPEWAAGELGGAVHPDLQSQGRGLEGAAMSFAWMFDALSLELIVETAALDNIRTAKLLDHLGFVRKGEITSTRPDGTTRASLVWEITKEEWREQHTPPSC